MPCKVYFLDNHDSFSYNLVDEFTQLGCEVVVYRNHLNAEFIAAQMQQETQKVVLVLSPGPASPEQAGCLLELIALCKGKFPMLGICLGHQALIQSYGGAINRSEHPVHGKASCIETTSHAVFSKLTPPITVARYHSLIATKVPEPLDVIAHYQHLPMAVADNQSKVLGFQFHPESILTPQGSALLRHSLEFLTKE